jgi:hypothetical protein
MRMVEDAFGFSTLQFFRRPRTHQARLHKQKCLGSAEAFFMRLKKKA